MQWQIVGSVVGIASSLGGCGPRDVVDLETLIQREIRLTEETLEAIESGAPDERIRELDAELTRVSSRLREIEFTDAESKRLTEKYGERYDNLVRRLTKARYEREYGRSQGGETR